MAKCDECGKAIAGVAGDAVYATGLGLHHYDCMKIAHKREDEKKASKKDKDDG